MTHCFMHSKHVSVHAREKMQAEMDGLLAAEKKAARLAASRVAVLVAGKKMTEEVDPPH